MPATSRASPPKRRPAPSRDSTGTDDNGMVTVEAAVALCAFVTVLAMVLAGMSMVLDQIRCTDAAREAARLVAMGARGEVADAVSQIAPPDATFAITTRDGGIDVDVRDPAANGLLPGVHVSADAYAIPEPGTADDNPATDDSPPVGANPSSDDSPATDERTAGAESRTGDGIPASDQDSVGNKGASAAVNAGGHRSRTPAGTGTTAHVLPGASARTTATRALGKASA